MTKLLRYGPLGSERPGIIDGDDRIRDLSGHLNDLEGEALSSVGLDRIGGLDPAALPLVADNVRIGACIARPGKFICVGLNYHGNAARLKQPIPEVPAIAMKALSAICGPNDETQLPRGADSLDWEVELGIVIGKTAKYVSEIDARKHVAGYCLINDLADRELQSQRGGDSSKGRGHDSFGPIGPFLVPASCIADPQDVKLWLEVDGERVQEATTADMIFGVDFLVSYISQFMTLLPGDIIASGTPAGIGVGMSPPRFLKAGQRVRLGGEGLGEQSHLVIAASQVAA
ncbi:fumarylacetoacetate hydrolase family protein (plasmid) [Agrobacterium rosae]|uniref:Fumarylacetoacetate hydrolase family protein n=1 Tax=Agrobacterium rosae TaxID=1972867 RepID=A0ABU4W2X2_9HYPH|nr:fumarylacetoacetate hydrolase family protein [Agrobacterium rosae]MDX8331782.1 fumarylacetoacetate hydrolase family protein [Agrobacterium rosae]